MSPFQWLFLVFLLVPLIEIYLLITVGSWLGALATVGMVVFTAVVGVYLLRLQGFATLQRVRGVLAQGQVPAVEMLEGVVLVVAGALLLTPGFFTDTIGFVALMPGIRRAAVAWFMRRSTVMPQSNKPNKSDSTVSPNIIEGEYRREDE